MLISVEQNKNVVILTFAGSGTTDMQYLKSPTTMVIVGASILCTNTKIIFVKKFYERAACND